MTADNCFLTGIHSVRIPPLPCIIHADARLATKRKTQNVCKILKQNPDILICDLAARVGFNTPKYFSRCFSKEFGMTINEYVERERNASMKT